MKIKDLGHIEVVEGGCSDCILLSASTCNEIFKDLTGLYSCNDSYDCNYILKKKEVWETCTRENTKVGLYVYNNVNKTTFKIKYILNSRDRFILENHYGNDTQDVGMDAYKIKVRG